MKDAAPAPDAPAPISVRGCRVHNLKNIDVDFPRGRLIAVCGLSGSGKSSLALDTLYAEGQRSYIESFSAYQRQYLDRLDKPDCDSITGLPPAIAVTRAGGVRTNRSTVGTNTEIADHVRLLFAKIARPVCPSCGRDVSADDPGAVAEELATMPDDVRLMIGFEAVVADRAEAAEVLAGLQEEGYRRLIIGGESLHLSDDERPRLAEKIPKRRSKSGTVIAVIVDRLSGGADESRFTESIETSMNEGVGRAVVWVAGEGDVTVDGRTFVRRVLSREVRCDDCDVDFPPPVPRLFNFNHPLGACPKCEGFGDVTAVDESKIVPDPSKTLREGAIVPWNTPAYEHELAELVRLAPKRGVRLDMPYKKLNAKERAIVWGGSRPDRFGGLDGFFRWLDRKKYKMHVRIFAARYRSYQPCPECGGRRFKPETLAYKIDGRDVSEVFAMTASELSDWVTTLDGIDPRRAAIARGPLDEIAARSRYLVEVGLGYLQLGRALRTLSGGETQRVSLTAALGSALVNLLYVLDEPTAGLHPADVERLSGTIERLRDRGNTVMLVEHNRRMLERSEAIYEIGPGAGEAGGEVVFTGTVEQMVAPESGSLTGDFLAGRRGSTMNAENPRKPSGWIKLKGASGNNLQDIDAAFPLGVMAVVTGVSGSGKSTLVQDTLFPAVRRKLGDASESPLPIRSISGVGGIDDCLAVDQSPIGRTARSVPVTYVKAMDPIRKAFAATVDAQVRSMKPGRFSFNNADGQCPTCEGAGVVSIDMQFLADVTVTCGTCRGRRYRDEVLSVRYRDRSIADVLDMTAAEAIAFFRGEDAIANRLRPLVDVGLEYVRLGQSATTLSSGEAQRMKLAAFLAGGTRKRTLFIMDEPTTGLHFADIIRLTDCFDALIEAGHSLIIVEHNPMLMAAADYIVDVGPGAADQGGRIVAAGTVAEVRANPESVTGRYL